MKAKTLLIFSVAAILGLLVAFLIRSVPQTAPSRLLANAAMETQNSFPEPDVNSEKTITGPQSPSRLQQLPIEDITNEQDDWASKPLPPGSNLQERLQELKRVTH